MKKLMLVVAAVAAMGAFADTTLDISGAERDEDGAIKNAGSLINTALGQIAQGTALVLPEGHYLIDVPITVSGNKSLVGATVDITKDPATRTVLLDGCFKTNAVIVETGAYMSGICVSNCCHAFDMTEKNLKVIRSPAIYVKGTVSNCVATSNFALSNLCYSCYSPAICVDHANALVTHCLSEHNYMADCGQYGDNGGAGVHVYAGTLQDSEICYNTVLSTKDYPAMGKTNGCDARGGGVVNAGAKERVRRCIIHHNKAIAPSGGAEAWGGGVMGNCEDCFIYSNYSDNNGGGVYSAGFGSGTPGQNYIYGCTISNNFCKSGTGGVDGQYALSNACCLIVDNVSSNLAGGFGPMIGSITDSILLRNKGKTGGAFGRLDTQGFDDWYLTTIKGCVVANNEASGGQSVGKVNPAGRLRLENCLFVGNTNSSSYVVMYAGTLKCRTGTVNNCVFYLNKGKTCFDGGTGKYAGYRYDVQNVTFKDNDCTQVYDATQKDVDPTYVHLTACLFSGNTGANLSDKWKSDAVAASNIQWCVSNKAGNFPTDETAGTALHNTVSEGPFFGTGCTPNRKAVDIIDKAPVQDWMASAPDMGNGGWTYEKVGTWGVKPVFLGAYKHGRIYGNGPDIGASEYWPVPGLLLMVK